VPVSLGCCDGGGPFGKRPEFKAGEKVGEAREPVVQTLRLRGFTLRSMETSDRTGSGKEGNRPKTYRGPESGIPFLCCLF